MLLASTHQEIPKVSDECAKLFTEVLGDLSPLDEAAQRKLLMACHKDDGRREQLLVWLSTEHSVPAACMLRNIKDVNSRLSLWLNTRLRCEKT